eukprot:s1057_g2.t1
MGGREEGRRTEDGGRRTDARTHGRTDARTEDGGRRTEDGRRKTEDGRTDGRTDGLASENRFFYLADHAVDEDTMVPSCRLAGLPSGSVWILAAAWHSCWNVFAALAADSSGRLRQEEHPPSGSLLGATFRTACAERSLFLRRLLSFLQIVRLVQAGAGFWLARSPSHSFWQFLAGLCPGVVASSTIAVLGFGTLVARPSSLPELRASFSVD